MTALEANSSSESFENMQAELTERSRREKNVLIFGVPESNTTEESKQVKNTLDAIDPKINEKLIPIFRLDDALYTLKRKSNIPRDKFTNIPIKTDLTSRRTEHLSNLRE
ncbi:hypothetical protein JTB14_034916 [Gonioctena quinquepunctata]|nr:hypothetical protein JTB14_034916 [Gonioctena quinquepunctata]